jgi:iron complex transport system substrate-binding protein
MTLLGRWAALLALLIAASLHAQSPALTLQAEPTLVPALEALIAAYEEPVALVEGDAALIATTDRALLPASGIAPHFLPEAFFVVNDPTAAEFAAFAVSPDGQQALIDAGLLPASVTLTDQRGNVLEIPQPVRRVITPFSLATYLVYGVDAEDRLVAGGYLGARTPIGAERMTAIDERFPVLSGYVMTQREINVEEVANLNPDVIFASARSAWLDTIAELNIPVVLFQGESPELLIEAMRITGQVFGPNAQAQAEAWIAYYERIVGQVIEQTSDLTEAERPAVLMVGEEALRVISGEMYQTDIIAAAGGRSVSAELTGAWNDVNLEQIVVWNPDVIVIVPYGRVTPQDLLNSPEWQAVAAVQNGRVFKMPSWVAPWDTPVPDSVLGVIWLAETLFPERVDLDCAAETVRFFAEFYQHAIPLADAAAVCGGA